MKHLRAGAFHADVLDHIALLAEDAAIDRVPDAIPKAGLAEIDEGAAEDHLAPRA